MACGEVIAGYLRRWQLSADGPARVTPSSWLCPVRLHDRPAWLKVALVDEERCGNQLMRWWNGRGAAEVYLADDHAIVLERAARTDHLVELAEAGGSCDDEASRILVAAATRLHEASRQTRPSPSSANPNANPDAAVPCPPVTPLTDWFAELFQHADDVGGFFADAAQLARHLLARQRDIRVLHGDLHHDNVLDFGDRGWLAIDPKGLRGDRAFDFANILCNPLGEVPVRPGRFERQLRVIAEAAELPLDHLVAWTAAWCGLSVAWIERDPGCGEDPASTLAVGRAAMALLG